MPRRLRERASSSFERSLPQYSVQQREQKETHVSTLYGCCAFILNDPQSLGFHSTFVVLGRFLQGFLVGKNLFFLLHI